MWLPASAYRTDRAEHDSQRRIEAKAGNGSLWPSQGRRFFKRITQISNPIDRSTFSKQRIINMAPSEYELLRQEDLDLEKKTSSSSRLEQLHYMYKEASHWLVVLLFASLSFNFIWVYRQLCTSAAENDGSPTLYGKRPNSPQAAVAMISKEFDSRTRQKHGSTILRRHHLFQQQSHHRRRSVEITQPAPRHRTRGPARRLDPLQESPQSPTFSMG